MGLGGKVLLLSLMPALSLTVGLGLVFLWDAARRKKNDKK